MVPPRSLDGSNLGRSHLGLSHWRFAGHLGLASPDAPLLARSARSVDPLDQIEALADLGFAGFEDIYLKQRPPAVQVQMARRMATRGITLGTFNGDPQHWTTPLWSSTDPAAQAQLRRNLDQSIALIATMGSGNAVCVAGLDPALPRASQHAGMAENLRRLGEVAAAHGLTLLVEAVARAWIPGLLIDRVADAAALVRGVNLPNVRLLFDTGHAAMEGLDVPAALAEVADILGAVQIADVPCGHAPARTDPGVGTLNWPAIFQCLGQCGYSGLIEVEHDPAERTAQGEARLIARLAQLG